jgi:hypothetical protein
MFTNRSGRKGVTLAELLIASSIFFIISAVMTAALQQTQQIYTQGLSRDTALQQLMKARNALVADADLASTDASAMAISKTPTTSPGLGAADGDALMMLSPLDADGSCALDDNNKPFWRRNVLYYARVPTDYSQILGTTAVGGDDVGYDYNYPIKHLMRVELDQNPNDTPRISSNADTLMAFPGLTQPTGFPRTPTNRVVAANLLSFRVQRVGSELLFDVRAVALADARKQSGFGTQSWANKPTTLQALFSVVPKNTTPP